MVSIMVYMIKDYSFLERKREWGRERARVIREPASELNRDKANKSVCPSVNFLAHLSRRLK